MPKILFKNPDKNKIVIFDEKGSPPLKMTVLIGLKYTILHSRKEVIHITPALIFLMVKNIIKLSMLPRNPILSQTAGCSLLGYIYRVYLFCCIDYIKPKVVVTFVDNCSIFHWVSRMYKNCEFYAIQNGIRLLTSDSMSMPNLFCFGQYEVDLYKKHGKDIDNFYPVGSLKGGFYRAKVPLNNTKLDFDICLVSELAFPLSAGKRDPKHQSGVMNLLNLVRKYITEESPSYCIVERSIDEYEQEIEEDYFRSIFGNGVKVIRRDEMLMSSYIATDRSSVVVALCSTLVLEAFGWAKKVLCCNLTGDDAYQLPLPEICALNVNDYEVFKNKLDYLRQLDESEYKALTQPYARYLMNYDFENPAHLVIRKMILEHL